MRTRSPLRSTRRRQARSPVSGGGSQVIPGRTDCVFLGRLGPSGMVDSIGLSSRGVAKKWHLLGDGTGYLSSVELVGTETVASSEGTASVSVSAGRIDVGVGTLWGLILSNGSHYEYPTVIATSTALLFDVSGHGRHLLLVDYTLATAVVESLTVGSDWLNQHGYTVADGTQYFDDDASTVVPDGVLIPATSIGSGCSAVEWGDNDVAINHLKYSEDFTNSVWQKYSVSSIDQYDYYQRITQSAADSGILKQGAIADSTGKSLTVVADVRPVSDGESLALHAVAGSTILYFEDYLPSDRFTKLLAHTSEAAVTAYIRLVCATASAVTVDIKRFHVFESMPTIYSDGDSISKSAVELYGGAICNSYTALFAGRHNLDYTLAAVPGQRLVDQIAPRMVSALNGANYPLVFLCAGTNDITQAESDPVPDLLTALASIVSAVDDIEARLVIVSTPMNPVFTAQQEAWCSSYISSVDSIYGSNDNVTIIPTDYLIDPTDYVSNHPNLIGHQKIYQKINETVELPATIEQYRYALTTTEAVTS